MDADGASNLDASNYTAPAHDDAEARRRLELDRQEEKKRLKRAANRRSACTSRVRKKQFVEEMTAANSRLQIYGTILRRAPPTVTLDDRAHVRFASFSARALLGLPPDGRPLGDVDFLALLAEGPERPRDAAWVRRALSARERAWDCRFEEAHVVSGSSDANSGSRSGSHQGSSEGSGSDSDLKFDEQVPRPPPAPREQARGESPDSDEPSSASHKSDEDDDDACRLTLRGAGGRVVVVDAVRGGSFFPAGAPAPRVGGGRQSDDEAEDWSARAPPSPFGPASGDGGADFARAPSADSAATLQTSVSTLTPAGPRGARETVISLREVDAPGSVTVGAADGAYDAPGATVRSAVYAAFRAAEAPAAAPRSPPRIEELCGRDTTPDDLQNVVDGLMLIAGACGGPPAEDASAGPASG